MPVFILLRTHSTPSVYLEWEVGDVLDGPAVIRGEDEDGVIVHPRRLQGVIDGPHTRVWNMAIRAGIRIHFPSWIRNRIQYPDPDPWVKNLEEKLKNSRKFVVIVIVIVIIICLNLDQLHGFFLYF